METKIFKFLGSCKIYNDPSVPTLSLKEEINNNTSSKIKVMIVEKNDKFKIPSQAIVDD
jgi:hypothetical protein